MTSVCKVEHAPKGRIGVRFGYLEERKIRRIVGRKRELVDRRDHTGIGNRPFEIARCFTANDSRG